MMKPFCVSRNIIVSVRDAKTLLIKAKLPDFDSADLKEFTSQTKWTSLPLLIRNKPESQKFVRFYYSLKMTRLGIRIEIGFNLHEPSIEEFGEYAPHFELVMKDKTLAFETGDIDDQLADTDPDIHDMSDVELSGSVELTIATLKKWINHDGMLWIQCILNDDDDDDDDIFEYQPETETQVSFLDGPASVGIKNFFKSKPFDIHFVVGEHEIGSHKFILSVHSDALSSILTEANSDKIVIEDADVDGVRQFVNILHAFEATFKHDDPVMAFKVKALAKQYGVEYIEKAAASIYDISQLNKNNFVELFNLTKDDNELRKILLRDFIFLKINPNNLKGWEKIDAATKEFIKSQQEPAKKKKKR